MKKLFTIIFLFICLTIQATKYYLAPTTATPAGSDANAGTIGAPFFTLNKAWTVVAAGDTVYMRGGVYSYLSTQLLKDKNGSAGNLINIWNYNDEIPIITRTSGTFTWEYGGYIGGVWTNGEYLYFKGLEVTGFEQVEGGSVYNAWVNYAVKHCKFELLNVHHNGNGMMSLFDNDDNLFLNCDFHHSEDPLTSGTPYQNGDGMILAYNTNISASNIIRGCRFWNNCDDGLDMINNQGFVYLDSCFAWFNGYTRAGVSAAPYGDGNGFKLGGPLNTSTDLKRKLTNNIAYNNRNWGFSCEEDENKNNMEVFNNITYLNGTSAGGGFKLNSSGVAYNIKNNISYLETTYNNEWYGITTWTNVDHNSFTNGSNTATVDDFASLDSTGISGARQASGTLPVLTFLQLASTSDYINQGVYVGIDTIGPGVDLGAFEYVSTTGNPLIATVQTTTISIETATGNGIVTYDGGSTVTDRGICWGTSPNPTLAGTHGHSGSGTGAFSVSLINLLPDTQYYARAFAINGVGTAYGADVLFDTFPNKLLRSASGKLLRSASGKLIRK